MPSIERTIRRKFHIHRGDTPPYSGWLKSSKREDIYDLFGELGFKYGAEIGVRRAANALEMCRRIPDLKLVCVDPWTPYSRSITQARADRNFEISKNRLKPYKSVFMRQTSMDAVKEFEDNTFDFVYIDGLHDFDNVMMDLIHWTKKVKRRGIVSGHDYHHAARSGVVRAVDAYTLAHDIRGPYLTREHISSFFFIKP